MLGYLYGKRFGSKIESAYRLFPYKYSNILKLSHPSYLQNRQGVPKCRYIKFRRRGIAQQKAYSIQNMADIWNQKRKNCNALCAKKDIYIQLLDVTAVGMCNYLQLCFWRLCASGTLISQPVTVPGAYQSAQHNTDTPTSLYIIYAHV